jgi:hypothetical protein
VPLTTDLAFELIFDTCDHEDRVQTIEMNGLGATECESCATEVHHSVDFPIICPNPMRAMCEPHFGYRGAAGVSYVVEAWYPANVVSRASPGRSSFGSSPTAGSNPSSHQNAVQRRFSSVNCYCKTII